MENTTPEKYTTKHLEAIAAKLRSMPPVEEENRQHTDEEMIKILSKEIIALQRRGYTLDQVSKMLKVEGLDIWPVTLGPYLPRTPKSNLPETPPEVHRIKRIFIAAVGIMVLITVIAVVYTAIPFSRKAENVVYSNSTPNMQQILQSAPKNTGLVPALVPASKATNPTTDTDGAKPLRGTEKPEIAPGQQAVSSSPKVFLTPATAGKLTPAQKSLPASAQ